MFFQACGTTCSVALSNPSRCVRCAGLRFRTGIRAPACASGLTAVRFGAFGAPGLCSGLTAARFDVFGAPGLYSGLSVVQRLFAT